MRNTVTTDCTHRERNKLWRVILGVMLVSLMLFAGQSVLIPAAQAATQATLTSIAFNTQALPNGSVQRLQATYDIAPAASHPTTLRIDFPSEIVGLADSFPILEDPNDPSSVIGTCVVAASNIECTFSEAFISGNQAGASGKIEFEVQVTISENTITQKTFDFGGVMTPPVSVYPPSGPCEEDCDFMGQDASKRGQYIREGEKIRWGIRVPAPADGMPIGQQVSVTDNFDPAVYELIGDPWVYEARNLYLPSNGSAGWSPNWGSALPSDRVTITNSGRTISFTTGPGLPSDADHRGLTGSVYLVMFDLRVLDEGRAGTYTNEAKITIEGVEEGTVPGTVTRQSGSGTAVGNAFGKFAITKRLDGDLPANVPSSFTLKWEITDPAKPNEPATTGTAQLVPGEIFYGPEIRDGYRVVVTEVLPDADEFPDGSWTPPVFTPTDSDGVPTGNTSRTLLDIVFSAANNNLGKLSFYDLTNTFTTTPVPVSSFTIEKVVTGDGAGLVPTDTKYEVSYAYPAGENYPAGGDTLELVADGTPVTVSDVPVGAVVTVSEGDPQVITGGVWGTPVITPETFTVVDGENVEVVVTNTFTTTPVPVSSFTIEKVVTGDGAGLVPTDTKYEVSYAYPAGENYPAGGDTLELVADGTPVTVSDVPVGAVVTVSEGDPQVITGGVWGTPVITPETFTVVDGENVEVVVTNTFTTTPTHPKNGLAVTGAESDHWILAGAALSILLGSLVVISRRNKSRTVSR